MSQTKIRAGDLWESAFRATVVRVDEVAVSDIGRSWVVATVVAHAELPGSGGLTMGYVIRWDPKYFRAEFRLISPAPEGAPPLSDKVYAARKALDAVNQIQKLCAELKGYAEAMDIHICGKNVEERAE